MWSSFADLIEQLPFNTSPQTELKRNLRLSFANPGNLSWRGSPIYQMVEHTFYVFLGERRRKHEKDKACNHRLSPGTHFRLYFLDYLQIRHGAHPARFN